jgi:hypothetical protein
VIRQAERVEEILRDIGASDSGASDSGEPGRGDGG